MHRRSKPDGAVRGPRLNPLPTTPREPGSGGSRSRRSPRPGLIVALLLAVATMPAGAQEAPDRLQPDRGVERRGLAPSGVLRRRTPFDHLLRGTGRRQRAVAGVLRAPTGSEPTARGGDLLARVLSLSDGPLADELRAWRPDPGVAGAEGDLLAAVGGQLAEALGEAPAEARARNPGSGQTLLQAMARAGDKEALVTALEDVDLEALTVLIGRDHVVRAGTRVEGGILLVDGGLVVRGPGSAATRSWPTGPSPSTPGGRIDGDARLVNSRLEGPRRGASRAEVAELSDEPRRDCPRPRRSASRAEVRRELSRPQRGPGRSDGFRGQGRAGRRNSPSTALSLSLSSVCLAGS